MRPTSAQLYKFQLGFHISRSGLNNSTMDRNQQRELRRKITPPLHSSKFYLRRKNCQQEKLLQLRQKIEGQVLFKERSEQDGRVEQWFSNFGLYQNYLEVCENTEDQASPPNFLIQQVQGRAGEFTFLTSSQVMLLLLFCRPHIERLSSKVRNEMKRHNQVVYFNELKRVQILCS